MKEWMYEWDQWNLYFIGKYCESETAKGPLAVGESLDSWTEDRPIPCSWSNLTTDDGKSNIARFGCSCHSLENSEDEIFHPSSRTIKRWCRLCQIANEELMNIVIHKLTCLDTRCKCWVAVQCTLYIDLKMPSTTWRRFPSISDKFQSLSHQSPSFCLWRARSDGLSVPRSVTDGVSLWEASPASPASQVCQFVDDWETELAKVGGEKRLHSTTPQTEQGGDGREDGGEDRGGRGPAKQNLACCLFLRNVMPSTHRTFNWITLNFPCQTRWVTFTVLHLPFAAGPAERISGIIRAHML